MTLESYPTVRPSDFIKFRLEHGGSITGPEPHGVSVDGYGSWPQGQNLKVPSGKR